MWARVDRALNGVKRHGTRGGTDTSPRKWAPPPRVPCANVGPSTAGDITVRHLGAVG